MTQEVGDRNVYVCRTCGKWLTTVHHDPGVTPAFLACRATPGCEGRASSGWYRTPPGGFPEPTHEWYRPTKRKLRRMDAWTRDHVTRGGVLLRPIPTPEG